MADLIHNDLIAAKGAAMIDLLLIAGVIVAVLLADRVGRIRLQVTASSAARRGFSSRRSPWPTRAA
ncbi:MAG: hypothetical protein R3D52_11260 [Xanthobacteraceae bacterium]